MELMLADEGPLRRDGRMAPAYNDDGPGIYRARRNSAPERAEAELYLTLKVPFMPSAAWPDTVHSYL